MPGSATQDLNSVAGSGKPTNIAVPPSTLTSVDVPEIGDKGAAKPKASVVAAFDEVADLLQQLCTHVVADPDGTNILKVTQNTDRAGINVRQLLNKKLTAEEGR